MPRVARPPRAEHASVNTPHKQAALQSSLKIPLNDDWQEKAQRLQSRQALHDLHMNTLKAAATPIKKLNNYNRAGSDSPKTPRNHGSKGKENSEDGELALIAANAMTPMKRVPILANFEEWMKMATDNKINAANSWNFALIDYFHDMSLLREGDGVNFQKASCTLDGCVKIYTSRVDSVATETGKLLSGLADSGQKNDSRSEEDGEGPESGDDENSVKKKTKKRIQRSSEATLAPSFASLQLRKMELEFSVDPLFKKASADFDEGGAKGLLLNHLAVDSTGRIVFDSSDDSGEVGAEADTAKRQDDNNAEDDKQKEIADNVSIEKEALPHLETADIDIVSLSARFFPNLARLDDQDICPSLKNFDLGDSAGSLDIPFLKAPEDWRQGTNSPSKGNLGDQTGVFLDGDNVAGFEDDDDGVLGGFDVGADAGFGGGGDDWVKTAAIEPQMHPPNSTFTASNNGEGVGLSTDSAEVRTFDPNTNQYTVSLHHTEIEGVHENILSYFDNALQKNWAGPEHWRIKRVKDNTKPSAPVPSKRKEKEPFIIDFLSPLDPGLAAMIYTPATSNSAISLPKSQWRSKSRNLLPDDKHFNSRQLLQLFTKPKARIGSRVKALGARGLKHNLEDVPEGEMDEAFWARNQNDSACGLPDEDLPQGDYDANFFQDDAPGFPAVPPDDDDFADARENFSHGTDVGTEPGSKAANSLDACTEGSQEGAFGHQLVTQSRRLRPEYVQYARVAKKVDVRRLKEEMWRGIGFGETIASQVTLPTEHPGRNDEPRLKFTIVMNNLQHVYPKQAMADISTSYCFICLLHLANEKGLTLGNEPDLEELNIQRDHTAEITEGDA